MEDSLHLVNALHCPLRKGEAPLLFFFFFLLPVAPPNILDATEQLDHQREFFSPLDLPTVRALNRTGVPAWEGAYVSFFLGAYCVQISVQLSLAQAQLFCFIVIISRFLRKRIFCYELNRLQATLTTLAFKVRKNVLETGDTYSQGASETLAWYRNA